MGRRSPHRHRRRFTRPLALLVAAFAGLLLPVSVMAHPLGNFTINHYAGLTIGRDRVAIEIVIDMAEIPTFQERQNMDADGDGSVSDDEAETWAGGACLTMAKSLQLARDGAALALTPGSHAASFLPGAGGLSTLRLVCAYAADLASPIMGPTTLTFTDTSYAERIGWREIVASGDGVELDTHGLPPTSPSQKLTSYPADMIAQPLDIRSASIAARPGVAASVSAAPVATTAPAAGAGGGPVASVAPLGAVPGGVAGELPDIFRTADLTPFVLLASLATAVVLGAGHALTPGHGKTLMAAYLVGSRGTAVHAVGLGLSVAVSHTLGIFVLALLIVGAQGFLPPDVVVRATPVIAAISIVAIGGWMLLAELRRRLARRRLVTAALGLHDHGNDERHDHEHAMAHRLEAAGPHEPARDHAHQHEHPHAHEDDHDHAAPGEHSHGGIRHSHLPPAGSSLSWRGLFVLGLAGGLIPSTAALLILLGSIAAGRPAFGLVLVVAFGLGMAAVMTGVGLAMIFARGRLDRMPSRSSLGRLAAAAPLLASIVVLSLGVVLTWSAVAGRPVL